jgi:PAS domain S-box-containing protein
MKSYSFDGKKHIDALLAIIDEMEDLYNNAPCGYHSLSKDGIVLRMNDTELAWLGYARGEVIGKMRYFDFLAAESRSRSVGTYSSFLKDGYLKDLEFQCVSKQGALYSILVNCTAHYDADGNFVSSRSTVVDITALREKEREVSRLLSTIGGNDHADTSDHDL